MRNDYDERDMELAEQAAYDAAMCEAAKYYEQENARAEAAIAQYEELKAKVRELLERWNEDMTVTVAETWWSKLGRILRELEELTK